MLNTYTLLKTNHNRYDIQQFSKTFYPAQGYKGLKPISDRDSVHLDRAHKNRIKAIFSGINSIDLKL